MGVGDTLINFNFDSISLESSCRKNETENGARERYTAAMVLVISPEDNILVVVVVVAVVTAALEIVVAGENDAWRT